MGTSGEISAVMHRGRDRDPRREHQGLDRVLAGMFGQGEAPTRLGELEQRFMIIEPLGAGGGGTVHLAHDRKLSRRVAMKRTREESAGARARLFREARAMAQLTHENIVELYDVLLEDDDIVLVQAYVEGPTLRGWLETRPSWREVVRLMIGAGRGLEAAHRHGIVHRDFKPGNVLIAQGPVARVTDFGLARDIAPDSAAATEDAHLDDEDSVSPSQDSDAPHQLTRTGAVLGTPGYMAPEQIAGKAVDGRADQFSFCVTLYMALSSGQRPFAGREPLQLLNVMERDAPRPLPRSIPRWLRRAVIRGLALDPAKRWPSMTSLLDALERGLGRRPLRLRRAVVGAAALGAGALWFALPAGDGDECSCPGTPMDNRRADGHR